MPHTSFAYASYCTAFAPELTESPIELAATTPVPEWGGKDLWVGLEEDAVLDEDGRTAWVLKRQTEYHLVK